MMSSHSKRSNRSRSRSSRLVASNMNKFDKLYSRLTNKGTTSKNKYKKHMRVRNEISKCKNKPEISRNSKRLGKLKNSGVPIYLRYNQEIQKRQTKLKDLRMSVEK